MAKTNQNLAKRVKGKVRETIKFRFHLNSCRTVSKLESFTDDREYEAGCMKTRECKNYENINARKDWFKLRDGFLANFKKTDGEGFFTSLFKSPAAAAVGGEGDCFLSWGKWQNLQSSPNSSPVYLTGGRKSLTKIEWSLRDYPHQNGEPRKTNENTLILLLTLLRQAPPSLHCSPWKVVLSPIVKTANKYCTY